MACSACHTSTTAWTPVGVTVYKHLPNPPGYIPVSPAATGNHNTTKVSKCVQCHTDTKLGTTTILTTYFTILTRSTISPVAAFSPLPPLAFSTACTMTAPSRPA